MGQFAKISKIRKGEHMWLVIKVEGMDWSINQCRKVKEKLIQWYFWSPDSRKNKKVISKAVYIFLKAEKIEKLFLNCKRNSVLRELVSGLFETLTLYYFFVPFICFYSLRSKPYLKFISSMKQSPRCT